MHTLHMSVFINYVCVYEVSVYVYQKSTPGALELEFQVVNLHGGARNRLSLTVTATSALNYQAIYPAPHSPTHTTFRKQVYFDF